MRKILVTLAVSIAAVALVVAPASAGNQPKKDIVATAVDAGQFTTLASLLKQAGLVSALQGSGKLTVFAPTDAAFKKVPKATLAKLAKDKALLKQVLLYHVVKGNVPAAKVVKLKSAKTLQGSPVKIAVRGGKVFVNGAQVTAPDVKASNGTIHVINRVILPPAN